MKRGFLALLILGTACASPIGRAHRGYVERALFTTAVENHEPQDKVSMLANSHRKIYYFTELRGMAGQTVTHRWKYDGKVVAKVHFKVKGMRWRVQSSKRLEPHLLGVWSASVVDASGRTLSTTTFSYAPAAKAKIRRKSKSSVPAAPATEESMFERGARGARSLLDKVFGDD